MIQKTRKFAWRLRNEMIERLARSGDRFLYKMHVKWLADQTWTKPYAKYLAGDRRPREGRDETRILDRRFTLVQFCRAVSTLTGSTVECGVLHAVGSGLICSTLRTGYESGNAHFGFDSFEGLPAPKDVDRIGNGSHWWSKGALTAPYEQAARILEEFPFCHLVKGWIPECFTIAENHEFRFVHIDVDLYEPTRDSLRFFYPRMVPRGVILFDDHGIQSCPGARQAAEEFFANKPETIVELATGQAFVIKS